MQLHQKIFYPWPCIKVQPKSFVKHPRSANEARVSVLQSEQRLSSIIKLWIMITLLPANLALNSVNHSMGSLSANAPEWRVQMRLLELKIKASFQQGDNALPYSLKQMRGPRTEATIFSWNRCIWKHFFFFVCFIENKKKAILLSYLWDNYKIP